MPSQYRRVLATHNANAYERPGEDIGSGAISLINFQSEEQSGSGAAFAEEATAAERGKMRTGGIALALNI